MTFLARFALARPVAVTILFAGLVLAGLLSLSRLPVELLPDVGSPRIAVLLRSDGFTPEELEERWAAAVEARLMTVRHVRSVSSLARSGTLLFSVTCAWEADMDQALMDVQRAVGALASDPDVRELRVRRFDPRASPILTLGLVPAAGAPADLELLRRVAREVLERRLERIEGVAEVSVRGGRQREVRIVPDRDRLLALGLTIPELRRRVSEANVDADAGTLDQGGTFAVVRGQQRFRGPEDVAGVVLAAPRQNATGESLPVRLADVAAVRWDTAEVDNLVRIDGQEGVGLAVYKEADANTVAVTRAVRAALDELSRDLGQARLSIVQEQAEAIESALDEVTQAALGGAALAVVVLFLFLRRAGPTLVVACAIPLSILAALALMHAVGLSLNVMTLGGLALGTGMLVDSAIVVVENTVRQRAAGLAPREAALAGAGGVGAALLASTLAVIAVFLPVAFAHGLTARLFRAQALTVAFALIASLAVAALATPPLAARVLGASPASSALSERVSRGVEALVRRALQRRWSVLGAAALAFAAGLALLAGAGSRSSVPAGERHLLLRLRLAEGTRVEATQAVVATLEGLARSRLGADLAGLYAEIGRVPDDDQLPVEEARDENTAAVWVSVRPQATHALAPLVDALDRFLRGVPEAQAEFVFGGALGAAGGEGAEEPIVVEVRGRRWPEIRSAAAAVEARLRALPELYNVRSSVVGGVREWRLDPDPTLSAAWGLDPAAFADGLRSQIAPDRLTFFLEGDEVRDVVLRFPPVPPESLPDLEVDVGRGRRLPLRELGRLREQSGSRELRRRDQSRLALVTARVPEGRPVLSASAAAARALSAVQAPAGVDLRLVDSELERRRALRELAFLACLAIALVFMVLAALFESLRHPLTVLFTVPMGLTGAAVALWLAGQPPGVMAGIGLVILSGIVVNNAIVLVDCVGGLRREGHARREALALAAGVRLRPILMTSLTTALGLLPQLLGQGPGAELRAPLALVVVGGLASATLATLVLVPVAYDLIDGWGWRRTQPDAGA